MKKVKAEFHHRNAGDSSGEFLTKFNLGLTFELKTTIELKFNLVETELPFLKIKMLGSFVTNLGTRLSIICPVRRTVFSRSGHPKTQPE